MRGRWRCGDSIWMGFDLRWDAVITHRGGGRYRPLLEHIARRKGRRQAVVRVRHRHRAVPPVLAPGRSSRSVRRARTVGCPPGRHNRDVGIVALTALTTPDDVDRTSGAFIPMRYRNTVRMHDGPEPATEGARHGRVRR